MPTRPQWQWEELSPTPCAADNTSCHAERSALLVEQLFAPFPAGGVRQAQLERVASMVPSCAIVQVVGGRVLISPRLPTPRPATPWGEPAVVKVWYAPRIGDVVCLLRHAARSGIALPDVEMVACGADVVLDNVSAVPRLAIVKVQGSTSLIPVPMRSRGPRDAMGFNQLLNPGWCSVRGGLCERRPCTVRGGLCELLEGRLGYESASVPWRDKRPTALFRGSVGPASRCSERRDGPDYHLPLPCTCFRRFLVEQLGGSAELDVGMIIPPKPELPEAQWERHKLLLVIGNVVGWGDRFMASLFKSSATVLVDAGAQEWFYPLVSDGEHYLRTSPRVGDIMTTVLAGLANDARLHAIADAGRRYASDLFSLDNQALYVALVARAYSERLDYTPRARAGFIEPRCGAPAKRRTPPPPSPGRDAPLSPLARFDGIRTAPRRPSSVAAPRGSPAAAAAALRRQSQEAVQLPVQPSAGAGRELVRGARVEG